MEKLPSESLSGLRLRWNFTPCILNFSAETLPRCCACPCAVSRCPSWWVLCCQHPAYPAARSPPRVSRTLAGEDAVSVCLSLKSEVSTLAIRSRGGKERRSPLRQRLLSWTDGQYSSFPGPLSRGTVPSGWSRLIVLGPEEVGVDESAARKPRLSHWGAVGVCDVLPSPLAPGFCCWPSPLCVWHVLSCGQEEVTAPGTCWAELALPSASRISPKHRPFCITERGGGVGGVGGAGCSRSEQLFNRVWLSSPQLCEEGAAARETRRE